MMFKVQFEFADSRLLIALTTQLFYHGGRYGGEEYDGAICDEFITVLNEYKDCIKGFDLVKGMKKNRIIYSTLEGADGEDCYCEVWVSQSELEGIIA